jgi:hypothetical protein
MPTSTWDQSILSISPEELSEMTEEERRERLADEINRAADLLRTVAQAFGEDLGSDQMTLAVAASGASQVARKFM